MGGLQLISWMKMLLARRDTTLLNTRDGGLTWNSISTNGNISFQFVDFIDDTLGWASGYFENNLYKTLDGD